MENFCLSFLKGRVKAYKIKKIIDENKIKIIREEKFFLGFGFSECFKKIKKIKEQDKNSPSSWSFIIFKHGKQKLQKININK